MKSKVIFFILGMLTSAVAILAILPQYSDYRELAKMDAWLKQFYQGQIKEDIETSILDGKLIVSDALNLNQNMTVKPSGMVIYKAQPNGHILVLEPVLRKGSVSWNCIGGSNKYIPSECRN